MRQQTSGRRVAGSRERVNPAADLVDIFIFQGVTVGAFVQIINMRDIGP